MCRTLECIHFKWTICIVLCCLIPAWCVAEDLYAVRFGARSEPGFFGILWKDELVFHNANADDRSVRLLGVSNGEPFEMDSQLLVPAGRTVWAGPNWGPRPGVPLWVVHLDVPPGVIVQSRAEARFEIQGPPPASAPDMGSFSLPVFRALTAAGARQVHLGADLGSERSYVNVGIYNAGAVPATAFIVLRQGCDDSLLDQRTVEIPPNWTIQVTGLSGTPSGCQFVQGSWTRYVTVKVDQPSLSYIVNKKSDLPPLTSIPYNSPH